MVNKNQNILPSLRPAQHGLSNLSQLLSKKLRSWFRSAHALIHVPIDRDCSRFDMNGIPAKVEIPSRKLFELAGGNIASRTSPFCWRIRFALAEKQLSYESIPWRRVDKDVIEFTGQGKVKHVCAEVASILPSRQQQRLLQK